MQFLASLRLAVVLIALYATVIAWASFLESARGTDAVQFAIYQSLWFFALNVLLAVNLICAAVVRFPWRRRHAGFLITHLGILVLMGGCLLSRLGGIEARLPIVEGQWSGRAYLQSQRIGLKIMGKNSLQPDSERAVESSESIAFVGGPFNWDDYKTKLSWFPWRLRRLSRGVLFDRNGVRLEALDYHSSANRVELRLSVDDQTRTFWLCVFEDVEPFGERAHVVESDKRRVSVSFKPDTIDLGFLVFLRKFQTKLDPGSSMPSHYSSLVDFLESRPPHAILLKNVEITLNAPVDFIDPQTGRSWRLFQSSFDGPWQPGSVEFDYWSGKHPSRDELYLSIFTVSYDPGRALKYVGALLIVVGIVIVYYMSKLNFFRKRS
ncbi:MAG: hypothetical protein ACWGMZ_06915 [Thermoguttaceae bacterium]